MRGHCSRLDGNRAVEAHHLCAECEKLMVTTVRDIGNGYTALLLVATKQASVHMEGGVRAQASEASLPIRTGAWELCYEAERQMRLATMAVGWKHASDEKTTVPAMCHAVLERIERLFHSADAGAWLAEFSDVSNRMLAMLEPPEPQVAFGVCPECGGVVWGEPDADYGDCVQCEAHVHRRMVADRLLAKLSVSTLDGTPTELSNECARAGIRIPASTIRSWIQRGHIHPNEDGRIPLSAIIPLLKQRANYGLK